MAQVIQLREAPERLPEPGGFIETDTSRDIDRTLQLAITTGRTAMIAGRSGVGKTTAIDHFCKAQEATVDGWSERIGSSRHDHVRYGQPVVGCLRAVEAVGERSTASRWA